MNITETKGLFVFLGYNLSEKGFQIADVTINSTAISDSHTHPWLQLQFYVI